MEKQVNFKERVIGGYRGRNGVGNLYGLDLSESGPDNRLLLQPINGGGWSDALRLEIPKEAVPELITALQSFL